MTNAVTTTPQQVTGPLAVIMAGGITMGEIEVVRSSVFKNSTDAELMLYFRLCKAKGFDPLGRMIFPVKRNDKDGNPTVAYQVSIDALRSQADATGDYAGSSDPEYGYNEHGEIISAKVTVTKIVQGRDRFFTYTAHWSEFYPGKSVGFMWDSKPRHMLGKCAEAQALRKAFPQQLAGLYEKAELDRDEAKTIDITPGSQAPVKAADLNQRFLAKPANAPGHAGGGSPADAVDPASHGQYVALMLSEFLKLGVPEEEVLREVGRNHPSEVTEQDMVELRKAFNELRKLPRK